MSRPLVIRRLDVYDYVTFSGDLEWAKPLCGRSGGDHRFLPCGVFGQRGRQLVRCRRCGEYKWRLYETPKCWVVVNVDVS